MIGIICVTLSLFVAPRLASYDATTVGAWGFILSAWGIPLAIIGFAMTLWQLARTQNAANAASAAMEKVKKELRSFDIVLEVRTARTSIAEIQGKLTIRDWAGIINNYNQIRESLAKIDSGYPLLPAEKSNKLKDYRGDTLSVCTSMEEARASNFQEINSSHLISNLMEMDDFLISLEFSLKELVGGE